MLNAYINALHIITNFFVEFLFKELTYYYTDVIHFLLISKVNQFEKVILLLFRKTILSYSTTNFRAQSF